MHIPTHYDNELAVFPFDLIYPSLGTRKVQKPAMPIRTDNRFLKNPLLKQKEERRKETPISSSLGNKNRTMYSSRSP